MTILMKCDAPKFSLVDMASSSRKSFTAKFKFNPTVLLGLRSGSLRRMISTDVYTGKTAKVTV